MIFVDTNVIMYAVGRSHPLQSEARAFFEEALSDPARRLCSSAEVMQELLHAYIPVQRLATLEAAFKLAENCIQDIWAVEMQDVRLAKSLGNRYPEIGARDLLHLACCRRHGIKKIKTFDRAFSAAFLLP
jgi:predicted nucleic acid-binding protein